MLFDGLRALLVGEYVTPASGAYAGQLGPWADLVRAVGIDPRSTLMKTAFVGLGAAGLALGVLYVVRPGRATTWAVAGWAAACLWYVPVGTFLSLVILGLVGWSVWRTRPIEEEAAGP